MRNIKGKKITSLIWLPWMVIVSENFSKYWGTVSEAERKRKKRGLPWMVIVSEIFSKSRDLCRTQNTKILKFLQVQELG